MVFRFRSALVLSAGLFFASGALGQDKPKIYLGASSKTLGYSPLWVATKKGFFDQQGLDVQLVLLRGVPMTVQALAANSLHFGSGGPEPYIEASERGLDFVVTGGIINGIAQFLVAGKNYKTYEDLRGATFGTASLSGGTITALREALKLKGLEYPRDYKLLVIAGGSSANLAALAIRSDRRDDGGRAAQLCCRRIGTQCHRPAERRYPPFSNQCVRGAPLLGGKKPSDDGALHEGDGARLSAGCSKTATPPSSFLSKEMQLKPVHALKGWEFYTQNRFWPPDGDVTLEGMKNNIRIYADQTGAKGPLPDRGQVRRSELSARSAERDRQDASEAIFDICSTFAVVSPRTRGPESFLEVACPSGH